MCVLIVSKTLSETFISTRIKFGDFVARFCGYACKVHIVLQDFN